MDSSMRPSPSMLPTKSEGDRLSGPGLITQRRVLDKREKKPVEAYEEWVAVVRHKDGSVEMRSSLGMKRYKNEILQEAARKFSGACKALVVEEGSLNVPPPKERQASACTISPGWHDHIPPHMQEHMSLYSPKLNPKRRRLEDQPTAKSSSDFNAHLPTMIEHTGQIGPLYAPTADKAPGEQFPTRAMMTIRVDQRDIFADWLRNAFRAIQQQSCRLIAKEWIKLIHPKKQSTHPYNGNMPRNKKASPDRTKPPYWPVEVRHKEPDHIDKDARTALLVHLLMGTPQTEITPSNPEGRQIGKEIKAEDLLATLAKTKKEELKHKWDIIVAVIEARTKFESYEEGGLDASTEVHVVNYQDPSTYTRRPRTKSTGNAKEAIHEEPNEDNESRPASPMPTDTPSESSATPTESSNEDEISTMNASFSSTVTTHSSRSPRLKPPQSTERLRQNYSLACTRPPDQHLRSPFGENLYANLDFSHHNSAQSMIQDGWSPVTAMALSLNPSFTNGMLASHVSAHHCNQGIFSTARDIMNTSTPVMPYSEAQSYDFNCCDEMYGGLAFPTNPDINQGIDQMADYSMQAQYFHTHARSQSSRPSRS